ncbi:MAG: hypothetical protein JNG88_17785 [Phycisphaerales bacterium]|nr:hypothetical protein [Phycisphaerales bacterium]
MSAHLRAVGASDPQTGPIHILHVADEVLFAHFGRMFGQLSLGLFEEGFRISLVTDFAPVAPQFDATPVECHCVVALSGWRAWRLGRELDAMFERPPRLVHVWGTKQLRRISAWCSNHKIPLVVSVLSYADIARVRRAIPPGRVRVAAACERFAASLRSADNRWLTNTFPLPPALLVTDDDAIDLAGPHSCGIVAVGPLHRDGGMLSLLDAAAALRADHLDFQMALLSDGGDASATYARISQLKLHDCVSLIEDALLWDRAIAGADVMVVPNRLDYVTLAPLLAMALGRIVLAARGQPGDWFVEDGTCWSFVAGDAGELRSAMARAIARGPAALSLATSAAEYVARHFGISQRASELAAIYHSTLGTGQRSTNHESD